MNFVRKFFGSSKSDEIASIPSGKLFLRRSPQSPKGELECLYNDAFACIRQTTRPFLYQLCITRVYQEGELDTIGTSGFSDSEDEDSDDGPHSLSDGHLSGERYKDEWVFALVTDLRIRKYEKGDGTIAIGWKDLNGDLGDHFEFVVDEDVKSKAIESFMVAIYKCMYEQKYSKSPMSLENIDQASIFDSDSEDEYDVSEDYKSRLFGTLRDQTTYESTDDEDFQDAVESQQRYDTGDHNSKNNNFKTIFSTSAFDLYLFDSEREKFQLQISSPSATCVISDYGDWVYKLLMQVDNGSISFATNLGKDMSPTFNYDHLSFIFNYFTSDNDDPIALSWLLKFNTFEDLSEFQNEYVKASWEIVNKEEWTRNAESNKNYIINAFSGLSINDNQSDIDKNELDRLSDDNPTDQDAYGDYDNEDDDSEQEEDEGGEFGRTNRKSLRSAERSKHVLYDESDDESEGDQEYSNFKSSNKNSNLTVGYAKDRSYVVRGDKLGVFGNDDEGLQFKTTIAGLKDSEGNKFNPKNLMLHQQDQYMLMTDNKVSDNKLFKLDLNRGDIVDEWNVSKDPLVTYGPDNKFSQMTDEPTLVGVTSKSMFRIDPRLQGSKAVRGKEYKKYKTDNGFMSMATTQNGYKAVGSVNGDIRLYERLGENARTLLPSLGESIIGLDVSKDGRWLLATCKSYLLLINTKISEGQHNAGHSGFTDYFDRDKSPVPRRLALKPEHLAYMLQETNQETFHFTKAYFNTGLDMQENSIVTSFGPYIITWSLKKVLQRASDPYLVKRYQQNVVAENFKFGSNSDVIFALQDDVSMINRSKLRMPSKRVFSASRDQEP